MKKTKLIKASTIIAVAAIITAGLFIQFKETGKDGLYYVKRVIDGDTILLANGERVRYIGIDTPETKHPYKAVERFGEEADLYNKKLVEKRWVRLEFDVEKRDKYNRLLAYVYLGDLFVNAKLVEDGYAQIYTFPPNLKYQELFLRLQRKARENERGLWVKR